MACFGVIRVRVRYGLVRETFDKDKVRCKAGVSRLKLGELLKR
jgi:hypothetical protein